MTDYRIIVQNDDEPPKIYTYESFSEALRKFVLYVDHGFAKRSRTVTLADESKTLEVLTFTVPATATTILMNVVQVVEKDDEFTIECSWCDDGDLAWVSDLWDANNAKISHENDHGIFLDGETGEMYYDPSENQHVEQ